jgi:hypothetical protein
VGVRRSGISQLRRSGQPGRHARLRLAFDVTGDPAFQERGAFEAARELGLPVTTHAGVWGATNDDSIRLMWEGGFMAMRATLSADRSRKHLEAHARGETVVHNALRAEEVVHWATIGGAKAIGLDAVSGSVTVGKKADLVLIKNDESPAMYPLLHPYGCVVYQAGRGDVHTVLINGRIVKHKHRLVGIDLDAAKHAVAQTVDYARATLGDEAWQEGMKPDLPSTERVPNPYAYTDYDGGDSRHTAQSADTTVHTSDAVCSTDD